MNHLQAEIFARDALFEECVQMRRWDEGAKVTGEQGEDSPLPANRSRRVLPVLAVFDWC